MYEDCRATTSSPDFWAVELIRPELQDRLARLKLNVDPIWRTIRPFLPAGGTVLDAGCGTGVWVEFLRAKGFDAMGLDYSPQLLELLGRRFPNTSWLRGMTTEIPLASKSIDALVSWGVIEHDSDGPHAQLMEFHRVLRPGGTLCVTVPIDTSANRAAHQAIELDDSGADRSFFQYYFEPVELAEALMRAHFTPLLTHPCARHVAVAAPRLYNRVKHLSPLLRDLTLYALAPVKWTNSQSVGMVLAVGRAQSRD